MACRPAGGVAAARLNPPASQIDRSRSAPTLRTGSLGASVRGRRSTRWHCARTYAAGGTSGARTPGRTMDSGVVWAESARHPGGATSLQRKKRCCRILYRRRAAVGTTAAAAAVAGVEVACSRPAQ